MPYALASSWREPGEHGDVVLDTRDDVDVERREKVERGLVVAGSTEHRDDVLERRPHRTLQQLVENLLPWTRYIKYDREP